MNTQKKPGSRLAFIESGVSERQENMNGVREEVLPIGKQKSRYTFNLPDALVEHARAAVFYTPGLNLSVLVEQALEAEIRRLERHRGEAFPRRTSPIKTGRPMK
jgi:hypothetical protein